jgi:hypothetical protein
MLIADHAFPCIQRHDLSNEQIVAAANLSIETRQWLENLLADKIIEGATIEYDARDPHSFLQTDAARKAEIILLSHILSLVNNPDTEFTYPVDTPETGDNQ